MPLNPRGSVRFELLCGEMHPAFATSANNTRRLYYSSKHTSTLLVLETHPRPGDANEQARLCGDPLSGSVPVDHELVERPARATLRRIPIRVAEGKESVRDELRI